MRMTQAQQIAAIFQRINVGIVRLEEQERQRFHIIGFTRFMLGRVRMMLVRIKRDLANHNELNESQQAAACWTVIDRIRRAEEYLSNRNAR